MGRPTLRQAKSILSRALETGRVIVLDHAMEEKGGLRRYSDVEIVAELAVASTSGDIAHNRAAPGRFLAYGVELVICLEVISPQVVVVTVFEQGG